MGIIDKLCCVCVVVVRRVVCSYTNIGLYTSVLLPPIGAACDGVGGDKT